jgi:hypothetical protein
LDRQRQEKTHAPLANEIGIQSIHKQLHPVEAQPAALLVKIKVDVMYAVVSQRVDGLLECHLHWKLVSRRIDQVNDVLVAIERQLSFEVSPNGLVLREKMSFPFTAR